MVFKMVLNRLCLRHFCPSKVYTLPMTVIFQGFGGNLLLQFFYLLPALKRLRLEATTPSVWRSRAWHDRQVSIRADILPLGQFHEVLADKLDTAVRVVRVRGVPILQREAIGVVYKCLQDRNLLVLHLNVHTRERLLTVQSGTL